MPETFTPESRAIFAKRALAHIATVDESGQPFVSPVWVELDGDNVVFNTALGRAKARHVANDPRVALSLTDPDDPPVVIAVRGTVVGFTTKGADETIDRLAHKYTGHPTFQGRAPGDVRVNVVIRPDRIARQPGAD
ncbi:MAG TPA: TIGR03618 family F420-dependent PPOX class oxidoreductase [Acidimicrobiales bacterium]|nr:TIGR03618 family F420-dependent PPOX class oxidoreductase [Acidimicrobiales bacterium]